jgi:hypothetical protein
MALRRKKFPTGVTLMKETSHSFLALKLKEPPFRNHMALRLQEPPYISDMASRLKEPPFRSDMTF